MSNRQYDCVAELLTLLTNDPEGGLFASHKLHWIDQSENVGGEGETCSTVPIPIPYSMVHDQLYLTIGSHFLVKS